MDSKIMIKAAKAGNVAAVQTILESDPSLLHALDSDGSTPLHCAAWKGHLEVAEFLLKRGASVDLENENDHWGGTPLHAAAHANNHAIAKLLIAHGADPGKVSRNGRTPLEETTIHNATTVSRLLKQALAQGDSAGAGES